VFHPAVRLLAWCAAAGAVQLLDGIPLAGVMVGICSAALVASAGRFRKLLRRSRWLLLAIAVLFAWSTPGVLMYPQIGAWSPTVDGAVLGSVHAARLVTLVAALALLLEATPKEELVGAIYGLMAPLAALGVRRTRMAVRLMLVIQYAEAMPASGWQAWLGREGVKAPQQDRLLLQRRAVRSIDLVALVLLILGGALIGYLA
jgi:energy-coupling factor transporter transmembrane protein EcfT